MEKESLCLVGSNMRPAGTKPTTQHRDAEATGKCFWWPFMKTSIRPSSTKSLTPNNKQTPTKYGLVVNLLMLRLSHSETFFVTRDQGCLSCGWTCWFWPFQGIGFCQYHSPAGEVHFLENGLMQLSQGKDMVMLVMGKHYTYCACTNSIMIQITYQILRISSIHSIITYENCNSFVGILHQRLVSWPGGPWGPGPWDARKLGLVPPRKLSGS